MSKAEERALEAYPIREDFYRHDGVARSQTFDLNLEKRYYLQQGYELAEKDIKDALLKWTLWYKEEINKEPNSDGFAARGAKAVLDDLINKLNNF